MNWGEFFRMGGYGFYVWGAYGAVTLLLLFNTVLPIVRHRRLLHGAKRNTGDTGNENAS